MMRVCLVPRLSGIGGMVSFQYKLAAGLEKLGIQVVYDPELSGVDAILVIGGTRQLGYLWSARRRGIRIVQRLDGMNWIHRVKPTGWRHYLRAEYGNRLLALIRNRLADYIVYQSQFSKEWWERRHNLAPVPSTVIYNGIDLEQYSPSGQKSRPVNWARILLVEGSLLGGYEGGLEIAIRLTQEIQHRMSPVMRRLFPNGVELMVVGRVTPVQQTSAEHRAGIKFLFTGLVPPEHIPEIDRSAHLLYSADLNAACPNSVIEALACGLPVLAFDTGALPELVSRGAGKVIPYGGDPWKLDQPDVATLAQAALEILEHQDSYRFAARQDAEARFGLENMASKYRDALSGDLS